MSEEKLCKETEQQAAILTKKIQETDQQLEDLHKEQHQRQAVLEETQWQISKHSEQLENVYQEQLHFSDASAQQQLFDLQELTHRTKKIIRSQEELFDETYRTTARQLETTSDDLLRERGKLTW